MYVQNRFFIQQEHENTLTMNNEAFSSQEDEEGKQGGVYCRQDHLYTSKAI